MNANRWTRCYFVLGWIALAAIAAEQPITAQTTLHIDIEKPPFDYSRTTDDNRVSRLIAKLESKETKLEYTEEYGYLQSMLAALDISESSQTLVFSKTSMQVRHISRRNPRAIYFNDDTYLGWVRGSSLVEISTDDPKLGAAFYTVDMAPWRPKMERAFYDCLGCHATSMTQGIPGHTVRSVLPNLDGTVDSQKESFVTDHASPFSERWGGWYVTGRHGDMKHMGNAFLRSGVLETKDNGNLTSLRNEFSTQGYLLPYSDIVALMVLEHQTQMSNTLTRANFSVRQLLHDQKQQNSPTESDKEFQALLKLTAVEVVERMLFCNETPLTSDVKGSVVFVNQFLRRGPQDSRGRSLRQFDMKTRMFKYPCSYMIYSPAFDAIADELKIHVVDQLLDVLEGRDKSAKYGHLTPSVRRDILAILQSTKSEFQNVAQILARRASE